MEITYASENINHNNMLEKDKFNFGRVMTNITAMEKQTRTIYFSILPNNFYTYLKI